MAAGSVGVKLARDVEMNLYLGRSKLQIQSRKHIHIDMFNMISNQRYVSHSLGIANPHDPLTHDLLICDPLNTDALLGLLGQFLYP